VVGRTDAGAILLPQRAVQELQGLHNVFVVEASGKVSFKRVKMGRRIGPLWIVESGLTGADTVIIEGLQKARDGQTVTPQPSKIDDAPVLELLASVPGAKAETPSNK
jgi:membrane fusion protein (multidrug efflux system)